MYIKDVSPWILKDMVEEENEEENQKDVSTLNILSTEKRERV